MSKTNLGHWNTHAVFKNTPKKNGTGNETSHSFTDSHYSLTHRNRYISMATDKRIAGLQKEAIDE